MKIALRQVPFTPGQLRELDEIAARAGCGIVCFEPGDPVTAEALAGCEALLGYFPPNLLKELPALCWVQTPCAGVERFCEALRGRSGVTLTNSAGAFGIAIAEYLMAGVLTLYRRMPSYLKNQRERVWRYEGEARTIYGSTVTVVGLGNIGQNFAERMHAMGAIVRGVKRSAGEKNACLDALYPAEALPDAVDGADIVALCLPLTRETSALVSEEVLSRMKDGALLLNAGRGKTVDEGALIRALQSGKLGGAVLDVTQVEPLPPDSPLWGMDNVVLTPHISGQDDDPVNAAAIFEIFRGNLTRFLAGEPLNHRVDIARGY